MDTRDTVSYTHLDVYKRQGDQPAEGEERAAKDGERSRRRRSRRGGRRNREGQRLDENGAVEAAEGEGSDDDVAGDTEAGDDFDPTEMCIRDRLYAMLLASAVKGPV